MEDGELIHQDLTGLIISSAIRVHRALGPGLLESAYEICLCHELAKQRIPVERQIDLPIKYDGILLASGFRPDMVVDRKVIVELKSIDTLTPIHEAQLHTYLRLSDLPVGLLINSNVTRLRDGIVRRVLTKKT